MKNGIGVSKSPTFFQKCKFMQNCLMCKFIVCVTYKEIVKSVKAVKPVKI